MAVTGKEIQVEVIKYLKSAEYQKTLKKYENSYERTRKIFEATYEGEDSDYKSNEATISEKRMMIEKLNVFKDKLADIKWEGVAQDEIRKLLEAQIFNTKSHLYNGVTNSFGMSKDTAVHTEDDLLIWRMGHEKDFHLFIVSMMNPPRDDYDRVNTSEIYEDAEEYFSEEA